jgi:hypothetical protein
MGKLMLSPGDSTALDFNSGPDTWSHGKTW